MLSIIYVVLYIILFIALFYIMHYFFDKLRKNKLKEKVEILSLEKDKSYRKINEILRKQKGFFSYERIEKYLKKIGNPLKLSPGGYIAFKFLGSILFVVMFALGNDLLVGVIFAIVYFFSIDLYFKYRDKVDMRKITVELADVYDLIYIQTSSGTDLKSTLSETYLTVSNKRFKNALSELSASITWTNDISGSLDDFAEKFNSIEINSLVMTLKQSEVTGQSKQGIEDMSTSLKEMNVIAAEYENKKIKNKVDLLQILIFIGILAMIVYALSGELSSAFKGIF